jgi:hypothetical protein
MSYCCVAAVRPQEDRMSLQDEYNEFCRGLWADPDPKKCRCCGNGWALSDLDTWHQCPFHYNKDSRHPEDDHYDIPSTQPIGDVASAGAMMEGDDMTELFATDPPQCLDGGDDTSNNKEMEKVDDIDITDADMRAAEWQPAPPTPPPPPTDDEIPF